MTTLYAKWTGGYVSAEKTVVLDWSGVLLGDSSDTSLQGSGEWKLAQAYPSWIGGCSLYVPGGASGKLTDSAYVSMSGSFVFGIYATENNSSSERSCVLSLYNKTSGKVEYKINVRQRAKSSQGYSVVLNRGDGSGQTKSYTVSEGDWTLPTIASMSWTRLGYDFLGWGLSATQMSWIYKDGKTVWVDGPLELYAKWQESAQSGIVSVSFETRGGSSCSSRDYVVGRTYGSLPSTTQEGYTFLGWYANDSVWSPRAASAVYTTTEVSSSVTTLYARWRANSYTVKLDQQGGSGGTGSVRVQYGDITFRMPSITLPTRPGYRFEGYFTERNGSGTQYYNADGSACRAWGIAGDATLFALWRANVYTLTLGPNGGTGGSDKVEATKGQPMPAATAPTKSGYVFDGYWDTTKDGGKQYYDANMKSVRNWDKDGNVTLWAKWVKEVACKVTFGKNGGTGGDSYVTAIRGKPMPTPRTAPKLSGYTFCGYWDTLALDDKGNPKGKQYYDANMRSVRAWDKTSAATLWAKWTNKVTFGKNGGTGGDSYVTVTKGQSMPKRAMPTKSGYVFDGYWTSTGVGGVKYYNANGTSAHVWDRKGDTTLWAKWVKTVACKVTFGKNGGTGGDSYVTATYGKPMPTPRTAPKLSGYIFGGYWDTLAVDANGTPKGKQYYDANMRSVRAWDKTSAATLWAKWTNKVTFGKNGGTGGDSYVTVTKGQPMPKRAMPTKSGYVFDGYWTSTGAGGVKYYNANGTSAHVWDRKGDTTLWAKWVKTVACKVTFGKNGGSGGDSFVTATYGKPMPTPRTAPKLSGYTFGGYWDTLAMDAKGNPKGKQYYDAKMKSVRNWDKKSATTLWAKWTNKVTFGKNGGTGGDNYVTCTRGQPMPKRAMPTKSGYAFDGYWTSTGAGGVKYYNADGTSAHTWDKKGDTTLWAKWVKPVACRVTFGKNGGTGGDSYVTATTGKAMPTPRTAPKRTGWTFGGYWDTLACDASGNPKGKQYYDANMKSVRAWDKTSAATLWAKWTVRVKLGKNGGTGGDDYATVIYNQPFPKRAMPKRTGYVFGGYWVSVSRKTGQCYNADGRGTASMKWTTGGTPTIWALWTKRSSSVEIPQPAAVSSASAAPAAAVVAAVEPAESAIPAGIYSGVLADGAGAFWLMLDEPEEGCDRTAYLYVASEDGVFTAECTAEDAGGVLLLTTEDGEVYAFDPAAAILTATD